jgi:PST family polysaccharide transporter
MSLVQFGFDTPALKEISQNQHNKLIHSEVISKVFFSKLLLLMLAVIIFIPLLLFINIFRLHYLLFTICFLQVFSNILFPTWYFQGIQKMRVVTFIQLTLKLLSLPVIFLFIKQPNDIIKFAAITISTGIFAGIVAMVILIYFNSIKITWVSTVKIKQGFKDAMPFFLSNSMNTIKQQTASVLIGSFFTMSDVALYDLAMKIFQVPTTLISSINGALFPKMMLIVNSKVIKKVLTVENLIGILVILGLAIFGKWIILIMGGKLMLGAYPILLIISSSIFTMLSVGAIFNFVLIPKGLYKYIAINQFFALSAFLLFALIGYHIYLNVLIIPLAFAFSALVELGYSYSLYLKVKTK